MRGRRGRVLVLAAATAAVGGFCAGGASASDKLWNNPLGGSFHLDANWDGGVPGALVGGLILGVAESFVAGYLTLQLRDAVGFAVLIAMLIVRPLGLFGVRVRS